MNKKKPSSSPPPRSRRVVVKPSGDIVREVASLLIKEIQSSSENGSRGDADLSAFVVVFPNRRPLYYLLKYLAGKIKKPFFPPRLFSIGELASFVSDYMNPRLRDASRLDKILLLYKAAIPDKNDIAIAGGLPRDFAGFALWAPRIIEILEEMETSLADYSAIKSIELMTEIPPKIKDIISRLPQIKNEYYALLEKHNLSSYATRLKKSVFSQFDLKSVFPSVKGFYLCGFAELTGLENLFLEKLTSQGEAAVTEVILEEPESWLDYGAQGKEPRHVHIYSAYDTHSEVKKVREILLGDDNHTDVLSVGESASIAEADTAIIVPRAESLIPLLAEGLKGWEGRYNVSLGYPLSRTPLHGFFSLLMKIEKSRSPARRELYLPDYFSLLDHPYVRAVFFKMMSDEKSAPSDFIAFEKILKRRRYCSADEIIDSVSEPSYRQALESMHRSLIDPVEKAFTLRELSGAFEKICSLVFKESPAKEHPFADEFLTRYMKILGEEIPRSLIADENFGQSKEVIFDLFNSLVESEVLPFPGIPLEGLQILGLLEARNLSFKKLIVMDVNEGVIPGVEPYDPLLPPALRKILRLPTYRDREKLFRRNFMSLVAATSREVHIIYRSSPRDERSRYIEEIIWEKEKKAGVVFSKSGGMVETVSVRGAVPPVMSRATIPKNPSEYPDIVRREILLSPTSIDRYIHCPASFYYHDILGLRQDEKDIFSEPGAEDIGECVHAILRDFFKKYKDMPALSSENCESELERIINREIKNHFGGETLSGEIYLLKEVIREQLTGRFLKYERTRPGGFTILGVEEKLSSRFRRGKGENIIRIEGRIDRIDRRGDGIWLIDYKTGGFDMPSQRRDLEDLAAGGFLNNRMTIKKKIRSFQLPVYIWLYRRTHNNTGKNDKDTASYPRAAYYSLKEMAEKPLFRSDDNNEPQYMMEKIYIPALTFVIQEICDVSKPFEPDDEDDERCGRCPYKSLCAG